MDLTELTALLSDWYGFGLISPVQREALKQEAYRLGVADPKGCKTCPNFWHNILHNLINYVRSHGQTMSKTTGKYQLAEGTGSFRIPFSATQIIAEGVSTEMLKVVGDPANEALVESLLSQYPELSGVIVKNPDYKATAKAAKDKAAADKLAKEAAEKEAAEKEAAEKEAAEKEAAEAALMLSDTQIPADESK